MTCRSPFTNSLWHGPSAVSLLLRLLPAFLAQYFCLPGVIRVARGHFGAEGFSPAVELLAQLPGFVGLGTRQIMQLGQVVLQVVQLDVVVLVELDQLPVAVANRPAGNAALIAAMRVMPIQGSRIRADTIV